MKNYSQFIKEEIDLRGNTGIPDNFMNNAERQAERNFDVRPNSGENERQIGMQLHQKVGQGMQLTYANLNPNQLEERFVKLETLAKNIILSKYSDILDAGADGKPIELDIKILRPARNGRPKPVSDEIPDMNNIPARNPPRSQEVLKDDNIRNSVDKKKLLNVLNQGEAKATKNIIQESELVEPGLREIFGEQWRTMLNIWLETTNLANKLDWIMPVELKAQMMKDIPQGMAGACQVKWEKEEDDDETQDEAQDQDDTQETQNDDEYSDEVEMIGDQEDFDKVVIKAVGLDFPMLLHEGIKGIFQLLQSGAIKDDEELAKIIANNTSSFQDESQDFKYGIAAQAMFRDFINACRNSDKYSEMRARIYAKLALDKDRGGSFTDAEFLETTKSIFESFELAPEGRNLEFILNMDKFNSSKAKRNIEIIINDIVSAEEKYESEMREWESEKSLDSNRDDMNYDNDDDNIKFNDFLSDNELTSSEAPVEDGNYSDDDLRNMRQRDITELIDDALDAGNYDEVKRLSGFLKEGREIYLKEIERVNESHKLHSRRKK